MEQIENKQQDGKFKPNHSNNHSVSKWTKHCNRKVESIRVDAKTDPNTQSLKEVKNRHILAKSKRVETIYYANTKHKNVEIAIWIPDKIYIKAKPR